jgi:Ku protein
MACHGVISAGLRRPYYIRPDGEVGQQAFAVIREAIRKESLVALAKVVFTSRAHVIALEARDKGMLGITLRYPYEVRDAKDYFDDIADEKIPKGMLDLASHIVETKSGHFDPDRFEDQYEDALKDLLKKKQAALRRAGYVGKPAANWWKSRDELYVLGFWPKTWRDACIELPHQVLQTRTCD